MKKILMLLLLSMAMLLTACGGKEEPPAPAEELAPPPVETETAEEPKEPEPYMPAGTNPLTGEPMEPELEDLRPVAVMLNNLKAAMPQLGVSQADIIYEIPAEGQITRMLAVFQSLEGVGDLGSIRSTRPYYLETALGHDALLVHAGGSPDAYRDIPAWGVDNMDGVRGGSDAEIFWRDKERRRTAGYEHSMLTSGENIQTYLDEGHFPLKHREGYVYSQTFAEDGTPAGGIAAETVKLYFSNYKTGTFTYDPETKRYLIGQYGGEYIDGNTGEQVGVTNVLVLETAISVIPGDEEGRLTVRTTGEGKGTFLCGGRAVSILWSRKDRNSPFVYTTEDGRPLVLGQGKSYVCIMSPKMSRLELG